MVAYIPSSRFVWALGIGLIVLIVATLFALGEGYIPWPSWLRRKRKP